MAMNLWLEPRLQKNNAQLVVRKARISNQSFFTAPKTKHQLNVRTYSRVFEPIHQSSYMLVKVLCRYDDIRIREQIKNKLVM
jgi:hypothetical protein